MIAELRKSLRVDNPLALHGTRGAGLRAHRLALANARGVCTRGQWPIVGGVDPHVGQLRRLVACGRGRARAAREARLRVSVLLVFRSLSLVLEVEEEEADAEQQQDEDGHDNRSDGAAAIGGGHALVLAARLIAISSLS